MTYDPAVPQSAQSPSLYPPQGQANYGRLQTLLGKEHKFNLTAAADDGVHLQASMPNQTLNPAIPAGANGIWYVSGGDGYYKNTIGNNQIPNTLSGTTALTTSISTVVAVPANSYGDVYMFFVTGGVEYHCFGSYYANASTCWAYSNQMREQGGSSGRVDVILGNGSDVLGLNLRARTASSSGNGTYIYRVLYRLI